MTTTYEKTRKCAVCGNRSTYTECASTSVFGSDDLDTRPPEIMRSTISMWIQTCPSCGYCAPTISKRIAKVTEVVRSDSYRHRLTNTEFPKLASAFLCYSLLEENTGKYADAGWAGLHAGWVCDDAESEAAARECRYRAVDLFQKAKENGQKFGEGRGAEEALIVDLLRRSGQFETALRFCEDGLKKNPERIIADILRFQKTLIAKSDVAGHTVVEATGEKE